MEEQGTTQLEGPTFKSHWGFLSFCMSHPWNKSIRLPPITTYSSPSLGAVISSTILFGSRIPPFFCTTTIFIRTPPGSLRGHWKWWAKATNRWSIATISLPWIAVEKKGKKGHTRNIFAWFEALVWAYWKFETRLFKSTLSFAPKNSLIILLSVRNTILIKLVLRS